MVNENKKNDLACFGIMVVDVLAKTIDKFPQPDTSIYFDAMEIHGGGCAYNTAVGAARLGLNTTILGATGKDVFGDKLCQGLESEGIDISGVLRNSEANTGFSFVMVPANGDRRIYHTPGVNAYFHVDDIHLEIIAESKILHYAGMGLLPEIDGEPAAELLRFAQSKGVLTSLDPVFQQDLASIVPPCLPYLDYCFPNDTEAELITGYKKTEDQLSSLLDHGLKTAIITLGEDGALIGTGSERFEIPAFPVDVVDTCGAGDTFISGFLNAITKNYSLTEAAYFAAATAAHCVSAVGATNGIPAAKVIQAFVQKRT